MNTQALIKKAVSLPTEERALIAESLLYSLNQPQSKIDEQWIKVATNRLTQMRSGKVKSIDGQQVFKKIWHRFEE